LKSFRYEKSKINLDLKRCLRTENRKYFQIDRLKPIRSLSKLKVLYIAHNYIREWREFDHLGELPCLEDLVFIGNPLEEDATAKVSQPMVSLLSSFISCISQITKRFNHDGDQYQDTYTIFAFKVRLETF
jgi:Leucine-rich repeat (LRR) protein